MRRDLGERRQDEAAGPHSRVGKGEDRSAAAKLAENQQVDVDDAGAMSAAARSPCFPLDIEQSIQHLARSQPVVHTDLGHHVEKSSRSRHIDRLGLPDRGARPDGESAPRDPLQSRPEGVPTISQIRADPDVTLHEAILGVPTGGGHGAVPGVRLIQCPAVRYDAVFFPVVGSFGGSRPMSTKKPKGRGKAVPLGGEFRAKGSEAFSVALKEYEAALDLLRKRNFADAREKFLAIEAGIPDEPVLADRARTWATVCTARLESSSPAPSNPEDRYSEAVGLLNSGKAREAISLLDAALASTPQEGTYWYARAAAQALLRDAEATAADLRKAIALVPHLRFQAAQEPAFEPVRDEAAFIDVIEPSATGA